MTRCVCWLVLLACGSTACGPIADDNEAPDIVDDGSLLRIAEGTPEAFGVLTLLNDPDTTLDLLDLDVGLDVRAATSLIEHRNGEDGRLGTADDDLYETIAEADDQYYVGDAAFEALLTYATVNGWIPDQDDVVGVWEGVPFTAVQVQKVLQLVNTASEAELDDDVALDRRAAAGIVKQRPFDDVGTLAEVPYVGESALRKLQEYADAAFGAGEVGESCDTHADCLPELRCMGSIAYGSGIECVDTWGVFSYEGPAPIPDDGTALVTSVDVQGLASVPVDVVLTIDVDHPRPADLVLSIDNFNGYGTTLWKGGDDDPSLEMVVYAFPGDDEVHGLYNVHLTDTVPGSEGVLNGWDLLVISAYD